MFGVLLAVLVTFSQAGVAHAGLAANPLKTELSLSELESMEYDRPDDPRLKMQLAEHYWCRGDRGLAFEHWRWQISTNTEAASEARALLKMTLSDPTHTSLGCGLKVESKPPSAYPHNPR